uniref:Secreted protein n=1 Tax=Ascaris lumbricoides TaxID=6252 RepID=A0A0M3I9L0_ASCLU
MLIAVGLISIISFAAGYQSNDDSKNDQNDHQEWTGLCKNGSMQSPIDINLLMTRIEDFPNLIFKHYDVLGTVIAGNNGDTGCFQKYPFV